jgi:N-acyl-D-aspartate/D-glutamate deacylase
MKRRTFLQMSIPVAAGLVLPACKGIQAGPEPVGVSLVLRGGKAFYQGRWQTIDVGIDFNNRLRFGNNLSAPQVLSVKDLVIAPGFIDILADNSTSPETTYSIFERYKVSDGVTTALQMHGGSPDCGSYYRRFSALQHLTNFGVSTFVMSIRNRAGGLASTRLLIEKNLDEGALGVSHSIEYQPAPYAELLQYAKLAKKYDRPFCLHLRYSSKEKELDGVVEAIRLATDSGARLHIAHLHSTGGTFHMEQALEKIRKANDEGHTITTCVYPYSYWATYLYNNRFGPGWQERYGLTYNDLRIVGSSERLTARTFAHYRKTPKLAAVPEGTMPLKDTVDLALKEDFCMIGSDGGIQFEPRANSHPRGAGCFATAVRHGLDIGLPLEKIIEKMTALPRRLMHPVLKNRGVLEDGAVADLTVFDPEKIRGNATVENPNQFSSGIEVVIVNGKIAFKEGAPAHKGGLAIKA